MDPVAGEAFRKGMDYGRDALEFGGLAAKDAVGRVSGAVPRQIPKAAGEDDERGEADAGAEQFANCDIDLLVGPRHP